MEFEKLVSPSLKDLFITHIEAMILSGELPVGWCTLLLPAAWCSPSIF